MAKKMCYIHSNKEAINSVVASPISIPLCKTCYDKVSNMSTEQFKRFIQEKK